jgi:hypothetical protein
MQIRNTDDNPIIPYCMLLVARGEGAVSKHAPGIPRVDGGGGGVPSTAQAGTPGRTLVLFLFI